MLEFQSPLTGEILCAVEETQPQDLPQIFDRARASSILWGNLSVLERVKFLGAMRRYIAEMSDPISRDIAKATGKPVFEALSSEVYPVLEALRYYEKNAPKWLSDQKAKTPAALLPKNSYVTYRPLGTILVISPWNFPFSLSLIPAITALAAGNSVILKPSAHTLYIGKMIERLCKVLDFPKDLLQVVYSASGDKLGEALIEQRPDKVFFTGSTSVGRSIERQCQALGIAVDLELGGKDAMIVFPDANLERAASAAIWGAFSNSGQVCLSVERLYVHESIEERFISLLKSRIGELWQGDEPYADMGLLNHQDQADKVRAQIQDAVEKGASIYSKGALLENSRSLPAILLTGVTEQMQVMQEETFGPVLPLMTFYDEADAIHKANDSAYALGVSVFTSDQNRAKRLISRLQAANITINDVMAVTANMDLPFGGLKDSGTGAYHGKVGLLSCVQAISVCQDSGIKNKEIQWFPYSKNKMNLLLKMIRFLYKG